VVVGVVKVGGVGKSKHSGAPRGRQRNLQQVLTVLGLLRQSSLVKHVDTMLKGVNRVLVDDLAAQNI